MSVAISAGFIASILVFIKARSLRSLTSLPLIAFKFTDGARLFGPVFAPATFGRISACFAPPVDLPKNPRTLCFPMLWLKLFSLETKLSKLPSEIVCLLCV